MLDTFSVGTGAETYPSYMPYNISKTVTVGGTLLGELRVSKSLIDALIAGCGRSHETISFRAGELSYNMAAPQSMERLGYRFDSSRAVGDVARREGLWFHVDAAYAGVAGCVDELRHHFDGIDLADSIVINPHKWLFTPMDCSLFFCRRPDAETPSSPP